MLIILLVLSVALLVWGCLANKNYGDDGLFRIIFGIMLIISVCGAMLIMCGKIQNCRVIDTKIELAQDRCDKITGELTESVNWYLSYEHDTYTELKPDEVMSILGGPKEIYPQLKADKMIKDALDTYKNLQNDVYNLKMQKVNESIYKWWLYFGK